MSPYLRILAVSSVLMGNCTARTLFLPMKNLLVCCSWALPVIFLASLEEKNAGEEHSHCKPPQSCETSPSPDEDALLSGRLDVASDQLARLQGVHGQNLGVLGRFGRFPVQSGEKQLGVRFTLKLQICRVEMRWSPSNLDGRRDSCHFPFSFSSRKHLRSNEENKLIPADWDQLDAAWFNVAGAPPT